MDRWPQTCAKPPPAHPLWVITWSKLATLTYPIWIGSPRPAAWPLPDHPTWVITQASCPSALPLDDNKTRQITHIIKGRDIKCPYASLAHREHTHNPCPSYNWSVNPSVTLQNSHVPAVHMALSQDHVARSPSSSDILTHQMPTMEWLHNPVSSPWHQLWLEGSTITPVVKSI